MKQESTESTDQVVRLLETVARRIATLESQPREFGTGLPLYRAEIHGVEAIGQLDGPSLNTLADHLHITKGAASQMLRKLLAKGLVTRTELAHDRREVELRLTALGEVAYQHHARFHDAMSTCVAAWIDDRQQRRLQPASEMLGELLHVLDGFETSVQDL